MFYELYNQPTLTISAAAAACDLHQQTLRQYEDRGLITPYRTPGGTRMYSMKDVMRLKEIASLSASGVGLEGIAQIFAIKDEYEQMELKMKKLIEENIKLRTALKKERAMRRNSSNRMVSGYSLIIKGMLPAASADDIMLG